MKKLRSWFRKSEKSRNNNRKYTNTRMRTATEGRRKC